MTDMTTTNFETELEDQLTERDFDFGEKCTRKAKRRKNDYKKALKKRTIDKSISRGKNLYDNLHQYSKGSISRPYDEDDCEGSSKASHSCEMRKEAMESAIREYNAGGYEEVAI